MISLKQLRPKIWHLHFEKSYDLNLHFFRYQEFYESPKVKGKTSLKFVDLIEWYSNNNDGIFTYPSDWAGFNLPGKEILELADSGIKDRNRYDDMMIGFAEFIKSKEGDDDFYIIGTSSEDESLAETFNHELAHGLFFSDEEFTEKSTAMVEAMHGRTRNFLFKKLKEIGYGDSVLMDEAVAYMSTGLYESFDTKGIRKYVPKFERLFKKHAGKLRKRTNS